MKVKLSYYDTVSLTIDEVVKQAKHDHGPGVTVEVYPESNTPSDILYFALQQMITVEQLSLFYSSGSTYQQDLKKLKSDILFKIEEILDEVILDNEHKGT
jgi:hypothetical protein